MTQPAAPSDGLRLFEALSIGLKGIEEAALNHHVDLPAVRVRMTGTPVFDCEQVAVSASVLMTGSPGAAMSLIPQGEACEPTWFLTLELAIVRCGAAPNHEGNVSVGKLEKAAREISADVAVLMDAVEYIRQSGIGGPVTASISMPPYEGGLIASTARVGVQLP